MTDERLVECCKAYIPESLLMRIRCWHNGSMRTL